MNRTIPLLANLSITTTGKFSPHKPDVAATDVAQYYLVGFMNKYDSYFNFGTISLASAIFAERSRTIILNIDSGGGFSDSAYPLLEVIKLKQEQGFEFLAVCDNCYSAAYWVAAACDKIYLNTPMSGVGSIGAVATIVDDSKYFENMGINITDLYARQSENKNKARRDFLDGKPEIIQQDVDNVAQLYIDSVRELRPGIEDIALTGKEYRGEDAITAGLADAFMSRVYLISLYND